MNETEHQRSPRTASGHRVGSRPDHTRAPTPRLLNAVGSRPLSHLIINPDRLSLIKRDVVDGLKRSIKENGLINPITVTVKKEGDPQEWGYHVISGHHRVQAWQELNQEDPDRFNAIPVMYWEFPDDLTEEERAAWMRKMEHDENIERQILTKAELEAHAAAKLAYQATLGDLLTDQSLMNQMVHQSLTDGRKKGGQHKPGLASVVADTLEVSKTEANRQIKRAREELGIPLPKHGAYTQEQQEKITKHIQEQKDAAAQQERAEEQLSEADKKGIRAVKSAVRHWPNMSNDGQDQAEEIWRNRKNP